MELRLLDRNRSAGETLRQILAVDLAGMVFGAEAVRGEVVGQLDHLVGREGALAVQSLLEGASQRRAGIFASVVGAITLAVALAPVSKS